jgi:hypothetical protein
MAEESTEQSTSLFGFRRAAPALLGLSRHHGIPPRRGHYFPALAVPALYLKPTLSTVDDHDLGNSNILVSGIYESLQIMLVLGAVTVFGTATWLSGAVVRAFTSELA